MGFSPEDSKAARLLRWANGEMPGPWQVLAFPTNRCNLRCSMCWQRWAESKFGKLDHSREMSDERWLRLVDEAADLGVREWSIGGGGDPLVRADLVMRMAARIRERGMNGGIFTNAGLFKEDHLRQLVDTGWARVDISLDGPDAEVNDAIRSKGAFEHTTASLRLLAELRRKAGAITPHIDIHMVLTRLNVDRLDEMLAIAAEAKPSNLGVSKLIAQSEGCAELELTQEQDAALPGHLERLQRLCDEQGVGTNARLMFAEHTARDVRLRNSARKRKRTKFREAACFEPWLTAAVLPQGYVGPCCAFWDETAQDLHDVSLAEAWTGPYLQGLRKRMIAGDLPDYCRWCPAHLIWLSEQLRSEMLGLEKAAFADFPWYKKAAALSDRFVDVLRIYGIRGAARRGKEWAQLRLRR